MSNTLILILGVALLRTLGSTEAIAEHGIILLVVVFICAFLWRVIRFLTSM